MIYISGGNELIDPQIILEKAGVGDGMAVADLGCGGAGHFVIPTGQRVGDKGIVYAVDILQTVLHSVASRARLEGVSNVRTVWSDLEKPGATRIPATSLDAAFLINTLFQVKDHRAVIAEAVRLLKSGGRLLIVDWKQSAKTTFGPSAEHRVDQAKITAIVQALGLTALDTFDAGPYHFGMVFKK